MTEAWRFKGTLAAFVPSVLLLGILSAPDAGLTDAIQPDVAQPYFLVVASLAVWIGSHRSLEAERLQTLKLNEACPASVRRAHLCLPLSSASGTATGTGMGRGMSMD